MVLFAHRFTLLVLIALIAAPAVAASKTLHLTVAAPQQDCAQLPLSVPVNLPAEIAKVSVAELTAGGEKFLGQLTEVGLADEQTDKTAEGDVARVLHFVVPELAAGKSLAITAEISDQAPAVSKSFAWKETKGQHIDLLYGDRPVLRYMNEPFDDSSGENRERTYKVFHHVFDPSGEKLLTKGAGGRYTHHRGIYYGFSRCSYGQGKRADIWHCPGGIHQSHEGVLSSEAGPVLARHRLAIDWHGSDKKVFAKEVRELTVYHTSGGLLIDAASELKSADGKLKVDGDPQHAGFQFRASNDVNDKTAGKTYYVRPDGVAKPGSYRQNQQQEWNAMSFVLGDQRYTVAYLDHPQNPKPAYYSERNYGRFGSYFVAEAEGEKTIDINYRLWIQPGEMTVEQVAAHSANFTSPPKVTVK